MGFELNENPRGYWEGMPPRLKSRVYFFAVYYMITGYFAYMGEWWGWLLLLLPAAWWLLSSWFITEFLGVWEAGEQGLFGYTFEYVWNANVFVRAFAVVAMFAAALGGLGWIGTDDLRAERAKPSLTERTTGLAQAASDKAGEMADGAVEASKGWYARAKGWFAGDDESVE